MSSPNTKRIALTPCPLELGLLPRFQAEMYWDAGDVSLYEAFCMETFLKGPVVEIYSPRLREEIERRSEGQKTVADRKILVQSLCSLRPEVYVNDVVFDLLRHRLNRTSRRSVALSPYFSNERDTESTSVESELKASKFWEKEVVAFPFLLDGNHWICVTMTVATREIALYDSLLPRDKSMRERHRNEVMRICLRLMRPKQYAPSNNSYFEGRWSLRSKRCPQQYNCFDCGIFTALHLGAAVLGVDHELVTYDVVDVSREMLFYYLLSPL